MAITYKEQDDIAIIEFNHPQAKVNVLASDILRQFNIFLHQAQNNSNIKVLVIQSGKKDVFIAGADIKEIENITESEEGIRKAKAGQDIFNQLEDLDIPSIAVIDGVALGGGCELALACTYRVATFNEKVKIGLPEVNLGIIPGFGGTYRLPKVIGVTQALGIILAGRSVSGQEAYKLGLVDQLIPQSRLQTDLQTLIAQVKGDPKRKAIFNRKRQGIPALFDNNFIGHVLAFEFATKNVRQQSKGFYPAPVKALEVMQQSFGLPREKALEFEARGFGQLVVTDVSKNLIKVFYLTERYKKYMPEPCAALKPKDIQKCGVLGAGVMGGGIAQILSYHGITVRLKDVNYDALAKGMQAAAKVFHQAVSKRKIKPFQAVNQMAKISTTVDYSGFQNADAVIEAVVEKMEVKKKVFAEVAQVVSENALLLSNTSALSVTEMAKAVKNPARLMGFHFFNPVHRMPLVELISGQETSSQTIADSLALVRRLGKTPILVKDSPGFLVNRILLTYINEAGFILEEGAPVVVIDKVMTDFGMPMGPLLLSDEVGLDVGIKVLHILHDGHGARFEPAKIFEKITHQNLLGKKSGSGFYLHGKERKPNPLIDQLRKPKMVNNDDIRQYRDRLLMVMINEAARCLEDKIIEEPDTVDVGMILGTGFPPFRGGLLHYADQVGIENLVDSLYLFMKRNDARRFEPCRYLIDLKETRQGFYRRSSLLGAEG